MLFHWTFTILPQTTVKTSLNVLINPGFLPPGGGQGISFLLETGHPVASYKCRNLFEILMLSHWTFTVLTTPPQTTVKTRLNVLINPGFFPRGEGGGKVHSLWRLETLWQVASVGVCLKLLMLSHWTFTVLTTPPQTTIKTRLNVFLSLAFFHGGQGAPPEAVCPPRQ